jgi:hypothetical protein
VLVGVYDVQAFPLVPVPEFSNNRGKFYQFGARTKYKQYFIHLGFKKVG